MDPEIADFDDRLLAALHKSDAFGRGAWSLISPAPAWSGNPTWRDFIAYAWQGLHGDDRVLVVNYADHQGQCYLPLPFKTLDSGRFRAIDVMGSEVYDREGSGLIDQGLCIDLGPWRYNLFRLVDTGAKPLAGSSDEKITDGLDGLGDRLSE